MKTITRVLLTAILCAYVLSGCGTGQADGQLVVYSFSGENDVISISNGVIVISPKKEILYGGDLEGELSDIVSCTMSFYVLVGNDERVLLSNRATDKTGEAINIAGKVGQISGDVMTTDEIGELQNNLYFELETTSQNGEKNEYTLQLTLTEITKGANK